MGKVAGLPASDSNYLKMGSTNKMTDGSDYRIRRALTLTLLDQPHAVAKQISNYSHPTNRAASGKGVDHGAQIPLICLAEWPDRTLSESDS